MIKLLLTIAALDMMWYRPENTNITLLQHKLFGHSCSKSYSAPSPELIQNDLTKEPYLEGGLMIKDKFFLTASYIAFVDHLFWPLSFFR